MVSLAKAMSDEVVAEDDDMVPPAVTNTVAENVGGASIDLGPLVEAMVGLTSPSVQETDPAAVDEAAVVVREDTGEENIVLGGTVEEDVVVDEDRMDDEISPESAPAESETAESPATPIAGKGTGFRARGDDELLRIFQEIEDQEPEDTAAESAPPAAEETRIATVTLAEIYTIQGLTQKAIETYQQLLEQEPNNEFIRRKLEELEKGSGRK
jgi:hypothetical protein